MPVQKKRAIVRTKPLVFNKNKFRTSGFNRIRRTIAKQLRPSFGFNPMQSLNPTWSSNVEAAEKARRSQETEMRRKQGIFTTEKERQLQLQYELEKKRKLLEREQKLAQFISETQNETGIPPELQEGNRDEIIHLLANVYVRTGNINQVPAPLREDVRKYVREHLKEYEKINTAVLPNNLEAHLRMIESYPPDYLPSENIIDERGFKFLYPDGVPYNLFRIALNMAPNSSNIKQIWEAFKSIYPKTYIDSVARNKEALANSPQWIDYIKEQKAKYSDETVAKVDRLFKTLIEKHKIRVPVQDKKDKKDKKDEEPAAAVKVELNPAVGSGLYWRVPRIHSLIHPWNSQIQPLLTPETKLKEIKSEIDKMRDEYKKEQIALHGESPSFEKIKEAIPDHIETALPPRMLMNTRFGAFPYMDGNIRKYIPIRPLFL